MVRALTSLALLLFAGGALAQTIPVTLTATQSGPYTPGTATLTWNAPAPATACTATGGWSGAKAISGTQTVTGVAGDTLYGLACSGSTASVTVSWTLPTKNTDGSNYTDPKNILLFRSSTQAGLATATASVLAPTATTFTYTGLPLGTYFHAAKARNSADVDSALSTSVSNTTTAPSGSASLVVHFDTQPQSPVMTTATQAWAVKPVEAELVFVRDGIVGTVPLGVPCDEARPMGSGFYKVNRAKYVTWTTARRPVTVVAKCG